MKIPKRKPKKPSKKIWDHKCLSIEFESIYQDYSRLKILSLDKLQSFIEKHVPSSAKDVNLRLSKDEDFDWDGNLVSCYPLLEVIWKEKVEDPNYDRKLNRYNKKLAQWEKFNSK